MTAAVGLLDVYRTISHSRDVVAETNKLLDQLDRAVADASAPLDAEIAEAVKRIQQQGKPKPAKA